MPQHGNTNAIVAQGIWGNSLQISRVSNSDFTDRNSSGLGVNINTATIHDPLTIRHASGRIDVSAGRATNDAVTSAVTRGRGVKENLVANLAVDNGNVATTADLDWSFNLRTFD